MNIYTINEKGELLAYGSNKQGEIGLGDTMCKTTSVIVPDLPIIKKVFTYFYHTILLDNEDHIWVCGSNIWSTWFRSYNEYK